MNLDARRDVEHDVGAVIASRRLTTAGRAGKPFVLTLGAPERVERHEWVCRFQIKGPGHRRVYRAFGVDALQALLNAVEGARVTLEKTVLQLPWLEEGDPGIPRSVPVFFGRKFAERINRLIDREVKSFVSKAEARHRRQRT